MSKPTSSAPTGTSTRLYLALISFLSGAALMIMEISGNRLLAPVFGNSVYTWTSLIGVVLVAFSVGGFVGGYLVDKMPRAGVLAGLLFGAAVLTLLIPFLAEGIGKSSFAEKADLITGPLVVSVLYFLAPGILLGAVSPFVLRLYSLTTADSNIGKSAGLMSMLGALGSFAGTFLTGFYLLPNFGVRSIMLGTSVLLVLLSLIALMAAGGRPSKGHLATSLAVLALAVAGILTPPKSDALFHRETFYHQIQVVEEKSGDATYRFLQLDTTREGGQNVATGEVAFPYQQFWHLLEADPSFQPERALFLGAGAFGMPEQLSQAYPNAKVEVAEIDPQVIEVGKRFFKLNEFRGVTSHAEDGRRFLLTNKTRYDFIFGDAYNGTRYIPPHLTTREFFELTKSRLTERGLYMMNIISGVQGERAELLQAMLATLEGVFPYIEVFAVEPGHLTTPQNVIILASARPLTNFTAPAFLTSHSWPGRLLSLRQEVQFLKKKGAPIFTDDLNPLDRIIARQLTMQ